AEYHLYPNVEWVGPAQRGGPAYDGEADLVIAHPDRGILILEIKAGEPSKDASGKWWIGGHPLPRSPFIQAENSKHALIKKLTALPDWPQNRPPFAGHGVALPRADLTSLPRGHILLGPEAPIEIVIDASALETPEAIRAAIKGAFDYWIGDGRKGYAPGADGIRLIDGLLAAQPHLHRLVRGRIEDDRPVLVEATRDQKRILNQHRSSRRLEIVGPAGSGKSMLAAARARHLAGEGYRTLLVCFNQRLAAELIREQDDAEAPAGLVVTTFHRLCERLGRETGVLDPKPADPIPPDWWNTSLPEALLLARESDGFEPFHAVVVDEGQDFELDWLRSLENLLSVPKDDVFWVFHDPGQAVIRDDVVAELGLQRVELYENLRNPTSIAELSDRFYVGGESVAAYRSGDDTSRVRIETAEPGQPTLDALRKELHRLVVDEKVAPFRIAVLSGVNAEKSGVWHQRTFGNEVLVNEAIDDKGRSKGLAAEDLPEDPDDVHFETIRRFKGLERDVVVLVELTPDLDRLDQVLYTGLTRATSHLTVIVPQALVSRVR
nr:ATP-binding domain-containing protein [Chloroflexota bacterium]